MPVWFQQICGSGIANLGTCVLVCISLAQVGYLFVTSLCCFIDAELFEKQAELLGSYVLEQQQVDWWWETKTMPNAYSVKDSNFLSERCPKPWYWLSIESCWGLHCIYTGLVNMDKQSNHIKSISQKSISLNNELLDKGINWVAGQLMGCLVPQVMVTRLLCAAVFAVLRDVFADSESHIVAWLNKCFLQFLSRILRFRHIEQQVPSLTAF